MTTLTVLRERYETHFQAKLSKLCYPKNRLEGVNAHADDVLIGLYGRCSKTMDIACDVSFKYSSGIVPRGKAFRNMIQREREKQYGY